MATSATPSPQGHHLAGKGAELVPVAGGKALKLGSGKVQAPSRPDLQLAPGLRIDCSVYLEQAPAGIGYILMKNGEYQLRVNPASEGGALPSL